MEMPLLYNIFFSCFEYKFDTMSKRSYNKMAKYGPTCTESIK